MNWVTEWTKCKKNEPVRPLNHISIKENEENEENEPYV